jgi:positive regulator of sigma E activity
VSILLVFGLPLAFFMGGIWIGQQLEGGAQLGNKSAVGAIIGLIVAFLLAWIFNRVLTGGEKPEARRIAAEQ